MAAPLDRPPHATLLLSLQGTVALAPSSVVDRLATALAPASPEGGSFSIDAPAGLLVLQGGWWYRAEYRVLPGPVGSRVELQILNVAQPAHWAGPITGRAQLRAAPQEFEKLLARIADA